MTHERRCDTCKFHTADESDQEFCESPAYEEEGICLILSDEIVTHVGICGCASHEPMKSCQKCGSPMMVFGGTLFYCHKCDPRKAIEK